jgi:DNA-binding NarL/FixJ family response regulator
MADILIVEDHPIVVEGLIKILNSDKNAYHCFVAESGADCLGKLKNFQPSLILLDINLPDMSGIDLCKLIVAKYPGVKILALSSFSEQSIIRSMLKNGASGYLIKNSGDDEILDAVKVVLSGKKLPQPELDDCHNGKNNIENRPFISPREREVLQMIADGFTNHEIAEKMFISQLTVDSHRKNLLLKLDACNSAVLVRKGIEKGLIIIRSPIKTSPGTSI